jgi:NADH-quinone oxidoreductase subunit I
MCEEACPVDAIELTSVYDIAGLSREQMLFDREKLLDMYDQTAGGGKDPIRTHRGVLGAASDVENPPQNPPTVPKNFNNAARPVTPEAAHVSRSNPDLLNVRKD